MGLLTPANLSIVDDGELLPRKRRKNMSLISEKDQQALQKLFEGLEGDVTITNFTQRESLLIVPGQECDYCKETRELLEEVTALSDKLHLELKDFVRDKQEADSLGVTRIPAFVLQGPRVAQRDTLFHEVLSDQASLHSSHLWENSTFPSLPPDQRGAQPRW